MPWRETELKSVELYFPMNLIFKYLVGFWDFDTGWVKRAAGRLLTRRIAGSDGANAIFRRTESGEDREIIYERLRAHDVVFLIGIFVFSAVLVLGLFPSVDTQGEAARSFSSIRDDGPVVAAVYFIIISFRRQLSSGRSEAFSAYVSDRAGLRFRRLLPSLPISGFK